MPPQRLGSESPALVKLSLEIFFLLTKGRSGEVFAWGRLCSVILSSPGSTVLKMVLSKPEGLLLSYFENFYSMLLFL